MIGAEATPAHFALLELGADGELALLAETEIEFDYRTAPLPGMGEDVFQPKTAGIPLVGYLDEARELVSFYHYDGYDVRIVRARGTEYPWKITEELQNVHATREDLVANGDER